jgi:hypothetical protein
VRPRAPVLLERCRSGDSTAVARFRLGCRAATVRFEGVAPDPASAPEAFAAIARLLAMKAGRVVLSLPRLGRSFRQGSDLFQALYLQLYPQFRAAPLLAPSRKESPRPGGDGRRIAAFFSAGVDSYHLLVEHGERIDDLIFVRGFDVPFDDERRNAEVLKPVQAAASALGRDLIVAGTDLRGFSDPQCNWTWFVYGGLLSTAMLMERTHRTVLCGASVADRHLPPRVAELRGLGFGNGRAELRIEGRAATRVEKVAAVAASGLARDTLRVCWQNVPGTLNCGACHKCIRTVAALAVVGMLGAIAVLPAEVDFDALAAHPARTRSDRAFLGELLDTARANGVGDVAAALEHALRVGAASPLPAPALRPPEGAPHTHG